MTPHLQREDTHSHELMGVNTGGTHLRAISMRRGRREAGERKGGEGVERWYRKELHVGKGRRGANELAEVEGGWLPDITLSYRFFCCWASGVNHVIMISSIYG